MLRRGKLLTDYFFAGMRARMCQDLPVSSRLPTCDHPIHADREFSTYTYGDPTQPKARLRELQPGYLLVLYAGLKEYDCASPPALYNVGYFEVAVAGLAIRFSQETLAALFGATFPQVFAAQRDRLVLVKGSQASRLLGHAVKFSEVGTDRFGKSLYVLSRETRAIFGDFSGNVAIQRSPPRWVAPPLVEQAAAFVRS